jgi:hypothetical protein
LSVSPTGLSLKALAREKRGADALAFNNEHDHALQSLHVSPDLNRTGFSSPTRRTLSLGCLARWESPCATGRLRIASSRSYISSSKHVVHSCVRCCKYRPSIMIDYVGCAVSILASIICFPSTYADCSSETPAIVFWS